MLKRITLIFICLFCLSLTSCGIVNPKYIQFKEQENVGYYSNEIIEKINKGESFTLQVFDSNFYKYFPVPKEENEILYIFFNSISNENFKDELEKDSKDQFKLIIDFETDKYIIDVFDSNTISIYPWDGNYYKDIIDMSNVPLSYNLYDFCKYIQEK